MSICDTLPSRHEYRQRSAQTPPLGRDRRLASPRTTPISSSPPSRSQKLGGVFLRHRSDEDDESWSSGSPVRWDPSRSFAIAFCPLMNARQSNGEGSLPRVEQSVARAVRSI